MFFAAFPIPSAKRGTPQGILLLGCRLAEANVVMGGKTELLLYPKR
jgi:hypothetical protein